VRIRHAAVQPPTRQDSPLRRLYPHGGLERVALASNVAWPSRPATDPAP
jgi:hypothetical protein